MLLLVLAFTAGGGLLYFGWRGKRLDDHPLCAPCGFDLVGTVGTFASRPPDTPRTCPECGTEIYRFGGIRRGNRERRPAMALTGGFVIVCAGVMLAIVNWMQAAGVEIVRFEPFGLVRNGALSSDMSRALVCQKELLRRLTDKELSSAEVSELVQRALALQPRIEVDWGAWGEILVAANAAGVVSAAQKRVFDDGRIQHRVAFRPRVAAGAPMAMEVRTWFRGTNPERSYPVYESIDFLNFSVDGKARDVVPVIDSVRDEHGRVVSMLGDEQKPRRRWFVPAPAAAGRHAVDTRVRFGPPGELLALGGASRASDSDTIAVHDTIEVLPSGTPSVRVVGDQADLDAVARNIRFETFPGVPGPVLQYFAPPEVRRSRDVAFEVALERGGEWVCVGSLLIRKGDRAAVAPVIQWGVESSPTRTDQTAPRVRLRPSEGAAEETVDITEISGGKDIILTLPSQPPR